MAKSKKTSVKTKKSNKLPIIFFVLLFAVVGSYFLINSFAQTPAASRMYLTPISNSVPANTEFTVEIREYSSATTVNAVQANLTYPANLVDVTSVDLSTSAFKVVAQNTATNGSINIALGTITPFSGDQRVAVVHFKSKAIAGTANVSFAAGSALISSTTSTNILSASAISAIPPSSIVVTSGVADTTPPTTPTGLTGTAQPGGFITLNWNSSADNVKVTGYKVKLAGWGTVANVPGRTAVLNSATAGKTYTYTVQAMDAAGNISAPSASFSVVGK